MLKKILVAVDASDYAPIAIKGAITLAKPFNAELILLHVMDIRIIEGPLFGSFDGYSVGSMATGQMEELRRILDEKAGVILDHGEKLIKESGLRYEVRKLLAVPSLVIVDTMTEVDLAVMGARGEGARWGGAMLGSTVEKVAREGTKPLLITRVATTNFTKCLAAFDGSQHSQHSLALAANICQNLHAELLVLTVSNNEEERNNRLEQAKKLLEGSQLTIEWMAQSGDPGPVIIRTCHDERVDFVVIGAFGHNRVREAIIGSTTVEVMRGADVSVMLVK